MAIEAKWLHPDALGEDAALLDRAHQPRLYDRLDWFRMTIAHGLARRPRVLRVADGADKAWLFLDGTRPLSSWYTLAFRPIATDARLIAPLLKAAGPVGRLTLLPVVDDDLAAIRAALDATGWIAFTTRTSTNWTIDRAGRDFAAYWAGRPGTLRSTVARRARSHPVAVTIHTRFDDPAWAAYESIYAASWKPAEGSFAFLRDLAAREGAAGTLRLGVAHAPDGRAVAAQLWLVERGIATIHKLAHREDARTGSPGSLLSKAMFAHAIDVDRVARIDFGLGDEPYKADWMEDAAPVWRIDAYRPGSVRGLAGIARVAARRLPAACGAIRRRREIS